MPALPTGGPAESMRAVLSTWAVVKGEALSQAGGSRRPKLTASPGGGEQAVEADSFEGRRPVEEGGTAPCPSHGRCRPAYGRVATLAAPPPPRRQQRPSRRRPPCSGRRRPKHYGSRVKCIDIDDHRTTSAVDTETAVRRL